MPNQEKFLIILKDWKTNRFPHKEIKIIATEYRNEKYVSELINSLAKDDLDVYLDFGGIFFWEYWKHNSPSPNVIKLFLFNVSNTKISDVTQYSVILALTSLYKNHNIYNKAVYNKLKKLVAKEEELSNALIEQIYDAIY